MKEQKRTLLKSASILSFANGIFYLLISISAVLFWDSWRDTVLSLTNQLALDGVSPWYMGFVAVLSVASLYGVVRMWKLNKSGFYIYALAQIALLFLPIVVLGWNASSSVFTIFTLLFFAIYGYCFFSK